MKSFGENGMSPRKGVLQLQQSLDRLNAQEPDTISEQQLFASVVDDEHLLAAVSEKAEQDNRALAASIVLEWITDDSNGFDELEALIAGSIMDVDDSSDDDIEIDPDKLSEEQQEDFNMLVELVGEFIEQSSGKEGKLVQKFIDEEDDELATSIIAAIRDKAKEESTDELIADFSVREKMILSAVKKVVRDGKVTYIKKRARKRKMTAKQRQALAKARKKSHNAAARAKRKKSNRQRARNGL